MHGDIYQVVCQMYIALVCLANTEVTVGELSSAVSRLDTKSDVVKNGNGERSEKIPYRTHYAETGSSTNKWHLDVSTYNNSEKKIKDNYFNPNDIKRRRQNGDSSPLANSFNHILIRQSRNSAAQRDKKYDSYERYIINPTTDDYILFSPNVITPIGSLQRENAYQILQRLSITDNSKNELKWSRMKPEKSPDLLFQSIKPNSLNVQKTQYIDGKAIRGILNVSSADTRASQLNQNLKEANVTGITVRKKRSNDAVVSKSAELTIRSLNDLPTRAEVHGHLLVLYRVTLNFTMVPGDANATSVAGNHCMEMLNDLFGNVAEDGNVYCNSSWDYYSCWPRTLAGTTSSIPCPGYLDGIDDSNNATKECYDNGTWAGKAVYNDCVVNATYKSPPMDMDPKHLMAVRVIYNVGYTISTLMLVVALFIFLYFRSLRCLRNSIHCHLILTFILKNIVWIIMRHTLLYLQDPSLSWLCKTLTTMFNFLHATNFFWMFVEGLYLHIIIVWTYSADRIRLIYLIVIGWGLPFINVVIWIAIRYKFANDHCWLPETDGISVYDYTFVGPILVVLFANIIFLSTIVWVLITKLRASHSLETRQYRKAVKATIILFPLLGITYVLFIMPPSDDVKIVFKYINAILQSFQGLLVAVFYCFLNGEVKGVLKKKISRFNDARSLSTKYTKTSIAWTRGSDYGQSVSLANGALIDPNRRPADSRLTPPAESIPLTDPTEIDKELD